MSEGRRRSRVVEGRPVASYLALSKGSCTSYGERYTLQCIYGAKTKIVQLLACIVVFHSLMPLFKYKSVWKRLASIMLCIGLHPVKRANPNIGF